MNTPSYRVETHAMSERRGASFLPLAGGAALRAMCRPLAALLALAALTSCTHVELSTNVPTGGILEDAILITSAGGAAPRETRVLGDVNLATPTLSFAYDLNAATSTHWWIIGHRSGKVVYTSNASLAGVDLYAVEPYNTVPRPDWNIPANLDAWVKGTTYSLDWWAATVNNHTSHVAPDTNSATLWSFGTAGGAGTTGTNIGTITVRLHVQN